MDKFLFVLLLGTVVLTLARWNPPSQKCDDIEIWISCGINQRTCENPCPTDVRMCVDEKAGCHCRHPYLRHNGKCILETDCPKNIKPTSVPCTQECSENEIYMKCGTCEPSCEHPNGVACPPECKPEGCYCQAPFVRYSGGACMNATLC